MAFNLSFSTKRRGKKVMKKVVTDFLSDDVTKVATRIESEIKDAPKGKKVWPPTSQKEDSIGCLLTWGSWCTSEPARNLTLSVKKTADDPTIAELAKDTTKRVTIRIPVTVDHTISTDMDVVQELTAAWEEFKKGI